MEVLSKAVLCWLCLLFRLYSSPLCHGAQVTGERCTWRNGVMDCRTERLSLPEQEEIVESFRRKGCGLGDITPDFAIDKDVCLSVTQELDPETVEAGGKPPSIGFAETAGQEGHPGSTALDPDTDPSIGGLESGGQPTEHTQFHPRSAKNVVVSKDGKSAFRKHSTFQGYGSAMSKRPILPGEIFDVWFHSMGNVEYPWIGITHYSPDAIVFPFQVLQLGEGTWSWDTFANEVIKDGETLVKPYATEKLDIQNGDRFGVSLSKDGSIHFHHNGRDLGPADVGLSGSMHAFVDMYMAGSNATIVE